MIQNRISAYFDSSVEAPVTFAPSQSQRPGFIMVPAQWFGPVTPDDSARLRRLYEAAFEQARLQVQHPYTEGFDSSWN